MVFICWPLLGRITTVIIFLYLCSFYFNMRTRNPLVAFFSSGLFLWSYISSCDYSLVYICHLLMTKGDSFTNQSFKTCLECTKLLQPQVQSLGDQTESSFQRTLAQRFTYFCPAWMVRLCSGFAFLSNLNCASFKATVTGTL